MISIQEFKTAIEAKHKCKACHIESVPVADHYMRQVTWTAVVETFELKGHPHAKRCYAWWYVDDDGPQTVTVLEIPPVDSADEAVRISLAHDETAAA